MDDDDDPVPTIPVRDVAAAAAFYLAALQPLGYALVSRVSHSTAAAASEAVGLGPAGSQRVDLFLSQSLAQHHHHHHHLHHQHICFPADSRAQVRRFYAAALDAGARPYTAPCPSTAAPGLFQALVTDLDGNRIEVFVHDDGAVDAAAGDAPPPNAISRWADDVASSSTSSHGSSSTSRTASPRRGRAMKPVTPPPPPAAAACGHRAPSTASSSHRSKAPSHASRASDASSSSLELPAGKTVMGALVGVAAAGALAYSMYRSHEDSARRERTFSSRMAARDRIKQEARDSPAAPSRGLDDNDNMPSWCPAPPRRRSSAAERDSGYYSLSDARRRQHDPDVVRYRSVVYPVATTAQPPSFARRSSSEAPRYRREIDLPPPASRSRRPSVSGNPPPAASPRVYRDSEFTRSPPSMPPMPPTRSRSLSSRSGHRVVELPPSPPLDPVPVRRSTVAASTHSGSHKSAIRTALPPSSARAASALSHKTASRAPTKPPSQAPSQAPSRTPTKAPSVTSSKYSYRTATAERVPLPASTASRRGSTHTAAANVPLPPSVAGTRLTERSLQAHQIPLPESDAGVLDDMETVVPDDSISCIGSDRRSRRSGSRVSSRRVGSVKG